MILKQDVLIILKVLFIHLKLKVHQKFWNQIWNKVIFVRRVFKVYKAAKTMQWF